MKSLLLIIFVLTLILISGFSYSQNKKTFCKAVEHANFKKAERQIKKVTKFYQNGTKQITTNGSSYTTYESSLDSITNWIKKQPCVEDAFWDKCQEKIAIYPGGSSIGVKFKTPNGTIEKCFSFQEGTTGQANIFGWRPKLSKAKNKLVYKKMSACDGFIETQKKNCN